TGPGTFSVYVRSSDPVQATLGMQVGNTKNDVKGSPVVISNVWTRLELKWASTAPYSYGTPWIYFGSDIPGVVEVDAAQFIPDGGIPFESSEEIQCGFYTDIESGVLHPGQQSVVGFNAVFPETLQTPVIYDVQCADQDGAVVFRESVSLDPADGLHQQIRREWIAPDVPGLYRWMVTRQGVENPPQFGSYDFRDYAVAVVQPPRPVVAGQYNFFSTCITPVNFKLDVDRARQLGMTLMRLHHAVSIADMNSFQPGLPMDQLIDYPHSLGLSSYVFLIDHHDYVANATQNPDWMDLFQNFCTNIFSYYEGKIQAYEFWNEPSYKLSLDQIGVYQKIQEAIQAAKQESGAQVTLVDISGVPNGQPFNQDFIDRLAALPETQSSDAIAMHFYMNGRRPEELLPIRMNSIRSVYENLPDKPIWDTESGYITRSIRPFYHWMWAPDSYQKEPWEISHWSVRHNLMEMEFGLRIKSEFIISGISMEGRYFAYGMFRGDAYGSARLRTVSYAAMSRLLARAEPVALRFTGRYGRYAAEFRDRETGRTVVALWQATGEASLDLDIPENSELFDVYGRTVAIAPGQQTLKLSEGPVYLVCDRAPELPSDFRLYDLLTNEQLSAAVQESVAVPPNAEWVLHPADCGFMVGFESNEKLLKIDLPVTSKTDGNMLVWDLTVPEDKAGKYVVWGAVASLFSASNSDLSFQLDGQPLLYPHAVDQPLPVSIAVNGNPVVLGWEKMGQVDLSAGHHQFKIRAVAKPGKDRLIQCIGGLAVCPAAP
ncbi:MAG: hypothetical protein AB7E95_13975, partial [Kiritimatiellales bacterium]